MPYLSEDRTAKMTPRKNENLRIRFLDPFARARGKKLKGKATIRKLTSLGEIETEENLCLKSVKSWTPERAPQPERYETVRMIRSEIVRRSRISVRINRGTHADGNMARCSVEALERKR